jgi:type I restriction enzyme, S subunit
MVGESPVRCARSWPVVALAEITTKIGSGATPRGGADSYLATRARFALVRSQNVFDRHFERDGLAFITDQQAESLRGVNLKRADILLNITGDGITFGRACLVPPDILPACVNQHVSIIRIDPRRADAGYVLAFLTHPDVKHYIESFNAGGSRRAVTKGHIESFRLPLPPLSEQRAIAHILGTLDDKIELNRRMSETLEAMARALFKSWFVDFDPVRAKMEGRDPGLPKHVADLFPDRLVDSELGEIPEDWKIARVGDIARVEKGLSYKGSGLADDAGLPMINLGCFAGGGQFNPGKLKRYRAEYRERHLVRPGDLLIANTDVTQNRIILGSPALAPTLGSEREYLFTHHIFAFRFCSGAERWKQFIYFALLRPEFREIAEGFATGTTVLALPRDGVLGYSLAFPPEPLRSVFDEHIRAFLAASETARQQSKTLTALRDALLPKLISGELRVKDGAHLAMETTA